MYEISETGRRMLAFQEELAKTHHYQPIEPSLFLGDVRVKYQEELPDWCELTGCSDFPLMTTQGTLVCTGYTRIVIGDYGAFVEISKSQICKENLYVQPGQEFRTQDDRFQQRIKYIWLTAKDCSRCKIYDQQRRVDYADYQPGMYYVSPYEVFPKNNSK